MYSNHAYTKRQILETKNITKTKGQIVLMQKGVKFRIYPNREQQNLINQTLGCCRLIYNKGLAMRNEAYKTGNKISYSQTSAMLTDLKKQEEFAFLKVVDSIALQQSLRDLDRGFVNFFQKRAAYPVFKSKHNHHPYCRKIYQTSQIRICENPSVYGSGKNQSCDG